MASTSLLIVKEKYFESEKTGIKHSTIGRKQLEGVVGTENFKSQYLTSLVGKWVKKVIKLT